MPEYIEREALIARLQKVCVTDDVFGMGMQTGIEHAINCTTEAPTADMVEVRHGEWIPIPEYENKRCSVCRAVFSDFTLGYYCPNCGAKMDRKEVVNSG